MFSKHHMMVWKKYQQGKEIWAVNFVHNDNMLLILNKDKILIQPQVDYEVIE